MSPLIRGLTAILLLLPAGLGAAAISSGRSVLLVPVALLVGLYLAVWMLARPRWFRVSPGRIDVGFPAWTRVVPDVARARTLSTDDLRLRFGWAMRIGVGGLWGGFGWLWTSKEGMVEFYVSRTDGLALVERRDGRSLLITPADPEGLVAAVVPRIGAA